MHIQFGAHVNSGAPVFKQNSDPDEYFISCEKGDGGKWLGLYPENVIPDRKMRVQTHLSGDYGSVVITWWDYHIPKTGAFLNADYLGCGEIDPVYGRAVIDETLVVPKDAVCMCVELRLDNVSFAVFENVSVKEI